MIRVVVGDRVAQAFITRKGFVFLVARPWFIRWHKQVFGKKARYLGIMERPGAIQS